MSKNIFKLSIVLLSLILLVGCGESSSQSDNKGNANSQKSTTISKGRNVKAGKKRKKSVLTPTSAGAPYELLLVAGEDDYQSGAADSLYNILVDDVAGIAQPEPCFKVSRITKNNLSKTLRLSRNIILVKIDPSMYTGAKYNYSRDLYASPQIVMTIQAHDAKQFINFVQDNANAITDFFTRAELNRQIDILSEDHQPYISEKVMDMFGCDLWAPTELNKIKSGRNFLWTRCERFMRGVEQNMNLVVYSYPYRDPNTFTQDYFVKMRDSVMKVNVPGPREGQYMMTTKPFTLVSDETVHGEYAQVVRGLWNIKGYDMGGPFVSVSRVDEKNGRVVVAEAFLYYPNQPKRNILKKLEAALYTLRLPDELDLEKFHYDLEEIIIEPQD